MFSFLQIQTPVPHDIPLDLPLSEWLLVTLLVISFLMHLLFVNMMVGGSLLALWAETKGRNNKDYDLLALEIAKTITVNKSLAVVLGVAPLLSINALYTIYFYSANALTGIMWILIIPLVAVAFLLTYLHKYTWDIMQQHKSLHIGINVVAVGIFMLIPLIFLVNVNLMLFPEKWGTVKGFMSALFLPNVFPRYFHFVLSSLAVTGLFLFWYASRKHYPFEEKFTSLTRYQVKRLSYSITLGASATQLIAGPLVLVTLPAKGIGWNLIGVILSGVLVALLAMYWLWQSLSGPEEKIGQHFYKIVGAMSIVVLFMGSGRHVYRANALDPHRALMAASTAEFQKLSRETKDNPVQQAPQLDIDSSLGVVAKGAAIFQANCSACHQKDTKLVGPPMTEMVSIYQNNPDGLNHWIKAPGKKRADYSQMPAFGGTLSDNDINEISKYILSVK